MKRESDDQRAMRTASENAKPGFEDAYVIACAMEPDPHKSTDAKRSAALAMLAKHGAQRIGSLRNEVDRIAAEVRRREPTIGRDEARSRAWQSVGSAEFAPAARETFASPDRETFDQHAARNSDPAFADALVVVTAANPYTRSTTAMRHLASLHLARFGDTRVAEQRETLEYFASAERRADSTITLNAARERGYARAQSVKPELFK